MLPCVVVDTNFIDRVVAKHNDEHLIIYYDYINEWIEKHQPDPAEVRPHIALTRQAEAVAEMKRRREHYGYCVSVQ